MLPAELVQVIKIVVWVRGAAVSRSETVAKKEPATVQIPLTKKTADGIDVIVIVKSPCASLATDANPTPPRRTTLPAVAVKLTNPFGVIPEKFKRFPD